MTAIRSAIVQHTVKILMLTLNELRLQLDASDPNRRKISQMTHDLIDIQADTAQQVPKK